MVVMYRFEGINLHCNVVVFLFFSIYLYLSISLWKKSWWQSGSSLSSCVLSNTEITRFWIKEFVNYNFCILTPRTCVTSTVYSIQYYFSVQKIFFHKVEEGRGEKGEFWEWCHAVFTNRLRIRTTQYNSFSIFLAV